MGFVRFLGFCRSVERKTGRTSINYKGGSGYLRFCVSFAFISVRISSIFNQARLLDLLSTDLFHLNFLIVRNSFVAKFFEAFLRTSDDEKVFTGRTIFYAEWHENTTCLFRSTIGRSAPRQLARMMLDKLCLVSG